VNWIAVATAMKADDKVHALGEALGVEPFAAVGLVVNVLTEFPVHARSGDLTGKSDLTLELWAQWNGPRGAFAAEFRRLFCASDGVVTGWERWNGAHMRAHERAKDRSREYREKRRNDAVATASVEAAPARTGNRTENVRGTVPRTRTPSAAPRVETEAEPAERVHPQEAAESARNLPEPVRTENVRGTVRRTYGVAYGTTVQNRTELQEQQQQQQQQKESAGPTAPAAPEGLDDVADFPGFPDEEPDAPPAAALVPPAVGRALRGAQVQATLPPGAGDVPGMTTRTTHLDLDPSAVTTLSPVPPTPTPLRPFDVEVARRLDAGQVLAPTPDLPLAELALRMRVQQVHADQLRAVASAEEAQNRPAVPVPPAVPSDGAPLGEKLNGLRVRWAFRVGEVEHGRFGKRFSDVVKSGRYPVRDLARAIDAFAENRDAIRERDRPFRTLEKFADELADWVRLGRMPVSTALGPTERGLRGLLSPLPVS
jgi:hypothetical protein